nr:hypothetical protein [Neobacillus sp. 179.-C4.2 HS]
MHRNRRNRKLPSPFVRCSDCGKMWVKIKFDAEETGNEVMTRWADMVGQSGGDSPEKAVEVILDLLIPESNEINGKFLWIKDGIKKPMPSWD